MRQGLWKLVVHHPTAKPGTFENEKIELYRLDRDSDEKKNLAEENAQQASYMLKQLKDWYQETQSTNTPQPGGWLSKGSGSELRDQFVFLNCQSGDILLYEFNEHRRAA